MMQKFLLKLEDARIVFDLMFPRAKCIASVAVGFLFAVTALASSEEVPIPIPIPIPVPAEAPPLTIPEAPKEKTPVVSKLRGVQNSPPFDLVEAKKCETELKKRKIKFTVLDKITDPKGCLAEMPLKLFALSNGVALSTEVTARCEVVLAFDNLISRIATPSAKLHLGKKLREVKTSTSYQCRTRNGAEGAKVSEHGFANGIDITGFKFGDDTVMPVSPKSDITIENDLNAAKFQAAVRAGACAYFTTVLGPGTNAAHKDHFHFDLAYRRGGYRLCE